MIQTTLTGESKQGNMVLVRAMGELSADQAYKAAEAAGMRGLVETDIVITENGNIVSQEFAEFVVE